MPPTPEHSHIDLRELARQAGFPDGFDLALYAGSAMDAFWYVRTMELLDRAIRGSRESLRRLAEHAEGVTGVLRSLDPAVVEAVVVSEPDLTAEDLVNLTKQLQLLSAGIRGVIAEIQPGQKGMTAEAGLTFAIRELYSVFHDHFPDEVGYFRQDEAEHGYDGKFYHLVRLLIAELGIQKSPSGIGKAIARSLKKYDP